MTEQCDQNCSSCASTCSSAQGESAPQAPVDNKAKLNEYSSVKKVIGIVSGKGGVGKSLVTSMMAARMRRGGYETAILDADLTGPSIPKAFGVKERAKGSDNGLFPVVTQQGTRLMSINLLLENESDPVVWRGPIIASTVTQFWTDVLWSDVDFMFIDMPPGTGDVALTVFQSLPVDAIIVVTSPQELVSMIVEKAVKMARMMNIPILGLIENMAYFKCPDCDSEHEIFGKSKLEEIAEGYGLDILARIPLDTRIATACDKGLIEFFTVDWLDQVAERLEKSLEEKDMKTSSATLGGKGKKIIAVAAENKKVTEHFGHCEHFVVFEAQDGQITGEKIYENPGHKPGFLPNYLHDLGVNVIIAGGMGGGAVDIFNEKGIEVIVGATGEAKDAVNAYLIGELESTGSVCHEHQHEEDGSC
ncbi:MAG TPA: P-loop NTPase [Clostridiaceae bacterium]|jgi:Mrp family chromosome partitioning ATPase/predicted Fe-Mo cluster-binding NifX family protein|nr:P-loop NTPase [Clostridiaceae bacterium]